MKKTSLNSGPYCICGDRAETEEEKEEEAWLADDCAKPANTMLTNGTSQENDTNPYLALSLSPPGVDKSGEYL